MAAKNTMGRLLAAASLGVTSLLVSAPMALAHHPMGGATPTTFSQGLLSGFGHPVIGFDHLAFVVAGGIAAALLSSRLLLPALFVVATIAGCLLRSRLGVELPFTEVAVAASVLAIGAIVMSGHVIDVRALGLLFVAAGLFHGSAYAGAIVGAETTPLAAYLLGFGLVQFAIMAGIAWATRALGSAMSSMSVEPRLAGAVVAGIGATFLIEHVEKMMFPGL